MTYINMSESGSEQRSHLQKEQYVHTEVTLVWNINITNSFNFNRIIIYTSITEVFEAEAAGRGHASADTIVIVMSIAVNVCKYEK